MNAFLCKMNRIDTNDRHGTKAIFVRYSSVRYREKYIQIPKDMRTPNPVEDSSPPVTFSPMTRLIEVSSK